MIGEAAGGLCTSSGQRILEQFKFIYTPKNSKLFLRTVCIEVQQLHKNVNIKNYKIKPVDR